jgi:purine-binding chemotaxis protein CheW
MSEKVEERYDVVLNNRAERLSKKIDDNVDDNVIATIALIKLGQEMVGVPIDGIREILKSPEITSLPKMPPWIMGIVQVRGELISVIDLSKWFGIEITPQEGFLVVVRGKKGPLGFHADNMLGFKEILESDVAKSYSKSSVGYGKYVMMTTKDLISVLDLTKVLDDEKVMVDQR